jgi:DNA-nicking Smr family endonuclease
MPRRSPDHEGETGPPAELDLHGQTVAEAQKRLELFLHAARVRALPWVRVITGRGVGNPTGQPLLRERIEAWCRSPAGRERGVRHVERAAKGGALDLRLEGARPPKRPSPADER